MTSKVCETMSHSKLCLHKSDEDWHVRQTTEIECHYELKLHGE